jgi:hypothetical protein|tara:strand:+ start:448 stop:693 length:246 start_codon:yes stop_codon:yes gene_type:complete
MRLRELMEFMQEFMDNKGKGQKGSLGDASVFMHVGNHLEEIKKIEVQESTIIGANSMRIVLKPMREKRIISPTDPDSGFKL